MMQKIEDMMEPYDENTEIPAYLEFVDMSKFVLKDYHTKGLDVVRLSNGYYDWYQVGGRWPDRFLIAANDPIYILGEKSWAVVDEEKKAPDGYRWVTGARKSAIQWELMKSLTAEQATELFCKLEQFLDERGLAPEQRLLPGFYYIINEGSWECLNNYPDEPEDGNEVISWGQYMERYLDGLPGDVFLVTLDCHD